MQQQFTSLPLLLRYSDHCWASRHQLFLEPLLLSISATSDADPQYRCILMRAHCIHNATFQRTLRHLHVCRSGSCRMVLHYEHRQSRHRQHVPHLGFHVILWEELPQCFGCVELHAFSNFSLKTVLDDNMNRGTPNIHPVQNAVECALRIPSRCDEKKGTSYTDVFLEPGRQSIYINTVNSQQLQTLIVEKHYSALWHQIII